MEKSYKIHPEVSCCAYKSGVLHDKDKIYPETLWPEGEAEERVRLGFLVRVESEKKEPKKK